MGGQEGLMELSKEEQGRGEKLFNRIDMDASGEISVDEIQQVLPNVGDKEIMMKILDENANGAVDLAEWYTYLLRKKEAKGARKFGFFLNYMDQVVGKFLDQKSAGGSAPSSSDPQTSGGAPPAAPVAFNKPNRAAAAAAAAAAADGPSTAVGEPL